MPLLSRSKLYYSNTKSSGIMFFIYVVYYIHIIFSNIKELCLQVDESGNLFYLVQKLKVRTNVSKSFFKYNTCTLG